MKTAMSIRSFQRTFQQRFRSYDKFLRLANQPPEVRAFHLPALHTRSPAASIAISSRRHLSTKPEESDSSPISPESSSRPLTDRSPEPDRADADSLAMRKALSPAYQLWFTCKKCLERSSHTISKQAYHFGTCVINCPKCKSQHLISDHLKIFSDTSVTLEQIAQQHGEKLRRGKLGVDGDVEFWDDAAESKVMEDVKSQDSKAGE